MGMRMRIGMGMGMRMRMKIRMRIKTRRLECTIQAFRMMDNKESKTENETEVFDSFFFFQKKNSKCIGVMKSCFKQKFKRV